MLWWGRVYHYWGSVKNFDWSNYDKSVKQTTTDEIKSESGECM